MNKKKPTTTKLVQFKDDNNNKALCKSVNINSTKKTKKTDVIHQTNEHNKDVVVVLGGDNNNNIDLNEGIELFHSEYNKNLLTFDQYGDYKRVQHAATVIQSAYRQHKSNKNYLKICERRSLNVDKLNSLDYSRNELLTPSSSSSSSDSGLMPTPTSISVSSSSPQQLSDKANYLNENIDVFLTSSSSITSFESKKNSSELDCANTMNCEENRAISSSSSSSTSLNKNKLLNDIADIELQLEADAIIKEQLDSVLQSNECEESEFGNHLVREQQSEILTNEKQLNTCTSVHSVYSNSTVSSKGSYLSSDSSILSNVKASNTETTVEFSSQLASPKSLHNSNEEKVVTPKFTRASTVSPTLDRKLMIGVTLFNQIPKLGIEYLVDNNYIDLSPRSIARFLLTNKLLSKQRISDYISNQKDEFSKQVLK